MLIKSWGEKGGEKGGLPSDHGNTRQILPLIFSKHAEKLFDLHSECSRCDLKKLFWVFLPSKSVHVLISWNELLAANVILSKMKALQVHTHIIAVVL